MGVGEWMVQTFECKILKDALNNIRNTGIFLGHNSPCVICGTPASVSPGS